MNKMTVERQNRLLPAGIPKWVRCYDNKISADRYTVVFTGNCEPVGWYLVLAMSKHPSEPQGVGMFLEYRHGELREGNKQGQWPPAIGRKGNLGTRIPFEDLPPDCKKLVVSDYKEIWGLS